MTTFTWTRFDAARTLISGLALAFSVAACSDSNTLTPGGACVVEDPGCSGCASEGDCCNDDAECVAGSNCNVVSSEFYDEAKPKSTCIRVVCASNADCDPPKKCGLEKVCRQETCQSHAECGNDICLDGRCVDKPAPSDAVACAVVSKSGAIRQGATRELVAVARDADGAPLPTIEFAWNSSATGVVAVTGNVATGGGTAGTATLEATVAGNTSVKCTGSVALTNFATLAGGRTRVVVVSDETGAAAVGATVHLDGTSGTSSVATDATGAVDVASVGTIRSVTVSGRGWRPVTILLPGANDLYLSLPRVPDDAKSGGFRGVMDLSATKEDQIRFGFVGATIPENILDLDFGGIIGESIPTLIKTDLFKVSDDPIDLPSGAMFGIGNETFTADARCQGVTPARHELGCFLAQAPAGATASWAIGGQVGADIVAEIPDLVSSFSSESVDFGKILAGALPLIRKLNHGLVPEIRVEHFGNNGGDPDYAKFARADVKVTQPLGLLSEVQLPTLPNLPGSTSVCAGGAIMLAGAVLPGRGVVPLGLSAGVDSLRDSKPNCVVDGMDKPFGSHSPRLEDGRIPLYAAPRHSGAEGAPLMLVVAALDFASLGEKGAALAMSVKVSRTETIGTTTPVVGSFPKMPGGQINLSARRVALQDASDATAVRVEIGEGDQKWIVYAPPGAAIDLPNESAAAGIVARATKGLISTMKLSGNYSGLWTFGSGATFDRLVDDVEGFAMHQCFAADDDHVSPTCPITR